MNMVVCLAGSGSTDQKGMPWAEPPGGQKPH